MDRTPFSRFSSLLHLCALVGRRTPQEAIAEKVNSGLVMASSLSHE
jgi:hypothetical protein